MIDATPYCWRIHLAQELAPKLYFHTRSLQGHRSVIFNNEGKVMYRTLEVPADWSICVGADGYPLYDVKAYALYGPPRDIVDGYFDASPVVEVLGLRTQDERGVDLVVKVLGNVNSQCIIDSRMLINAIEGPTVEAIRHVQKKWRAKRPLLDQLRTIHVTIRPELAMWRFDLSHHIFNTAEGVYARELKRAIMAGCPLGKIPEHMDKFVYGCTPLGNSLVASTFSPK